MNIDDAIAYHTSRKQRAETEGLLGSYSWEIVMIDKLETIKAATP